MSARFCEACDHRLVDEGDVRGHAWQCAVDQQVGCDCPACNNQGRAVPLVEMPGAA